MAMARDMSSPRWPHRVSKYRTHIGEYLFTETAEELYHNRPTGTGSKITIRRYRSKEMMWEEKEQSRRRRRRAASRQTFDLVRDAGIYQDRYSAERPGIGMKEPKQIDHRNDQEQIHLQAQQLLEEVRSEVKRKEQQYVPP